MDPDPLRDHLEKQLPPYMIPERIIAMAHFPRLVSGKLDRKAINNLLPE
jgi:acyl-coenzyme A synthetase/AMP-(fatty) acid ligase